MKKIIQTFLLALISNCLFSQVPNKINYQGVARDVNGNPVANQTIGLQFKISTSNNASFFSETQNSVPTNSLGLFTTQIGASSSLPTSGWEFTPCILNVFINVNNTGFVAMGTQTMASVPYALYALNSGAALPTATVNGSMLHWDQSLSTWKVDTNILSNGTRVSVGTRYNIQNNKFKSVADNASDSAAIFGFHKAAVDGMAGVRGFAAGASLPSSTLTSTGILGGHFVGFNLSGQGIGSLNQGYSSLSNGIGAVAIGSSGGTNPGNNYAVGLYATTDATSTAVNRYAGVFDRGNVLVIDTLQLGVSGNVGDVLTRYANGKAIWQSPPVTATASSSPFTLSANFIHLQPSVATDKVVIGNTTPALFGYGSKLTVFNQTGNSDTALSVIQPNNAPSIVAVNKNLSLTAFAGIFDGGLVAKGKTINSSAYAFMAKNSSGADLFSVRNDGYVGIGTSSQTENFQIETSSANQVSIIGGTNLTSALFFGDPTIHFRGAVRYDNQVNTMSIWTNNTPDRIFIGSNGFVGLKTNNPGPYDLSIFNPGNSSSIRLNNSLNTGLGLVLNNGSAGSNLISYENTPFNFGNNAVTYMTVLPNGNVGIANGTPSAKLDVGGTTKLGANGTVMTNLIHGIATITLTTGFNSPGISGPMNVTIPNINPGDRAIITLQPNSNSVTYGICIATSAVTAVNNLEVTFGGLKSTTVPSSLTFQINYIVIKP